MSSPLIVARTTLCGLADPSDFVRMFVMPAASTTARTAPPAMMPVPSGAGLSSTAPAPNLPTMRCGIVVPASGTRIRFFFAASMPFLMAEGTSFALPTPKPTTPWPSPTTTSALKLRFLPPLTTFVTRLIETTVSLISSCEASTFSRFLFIIPIGLELQTGFARGVGHRLHAPVVKEPVSVEHDALHTLFDQALGDGFANRLRARDVAAALHLLHRAFHVGLDRGRGRDRAAGHIVDDLHVHVGDAAEHGQARPRLGSLHALPDPVLDALAAIVLRRHPSSDLAALPLSGLSA